MQIIDKFIQQETTLSCNFRILLIAMLPEAIAKGLLNRIITSNTEVF